MKKLNILVLLFLAIVTNAQTKVKVLNEDGQPVPLAKIGFGKSENGTFTDSNGEFTVPYNLAHQEIKIEIPGYEEKSFNTSQIKNSIITLRYKVRNLEEVKLHPKKYKIAVLGYKTESKSIPINYVSRSAAVRIPQMTKEEIEKPSSEIAIPINFSSKGKVQKINLNLAAFSVQTEVPVRFIIYANEGGMPGKIVNEEDMLFKLSKKNISENTASFNISNFDIILPKGKYFLSFQPLSRDFEGQISLCGGFLGSSFERSGTSEWEKVPASIMVGMNMEVKMEK